MRDATRSLLPSPMAPTISGGSPIEADGKRAPPHRQVAFELEIFGALSLREVVSDRASYEELNKAINDAVGARLQAAASKASHRSNRQIWYHSIEELPGAEGLKVC